MRAARLARRSAEVQLHEIARPHFKYPALEDSQWYLPQVLRWEPLTELRPDANRTERRLLGWYILPSLVEFHVPPSIYVRMAELEIFKLHLQQRTGAHWEFNLDWLSYNKLRAERLSHQLTITSLDGMESTTLKLPAPPSRLKVSLWRNITRGLLKDEWRHSIETERHTSRDGETSLDLRRMRDSVYEQD